MAPPRPTSREEFFDGYWPALEGRGWKSAILHDWRQLPEEIGSDIDYGVAGCRPAELLRFLSGYCRDRAWRLVQVIEHEPGAYFCTCMQLGGGYQTLALDVTWDYRRLGHPLVDGTLLLGGRRRIAGKSFHVPAPGGEAAYIVAKAAAKNKGFEPIQARLGELIREDADGCVRSLGKAFGFTTRGAEDAGGLEQEIRDWFEKADAFRSIRAGRRLGWAEIQLYQRRILQPTGLWLTFGDPVPDKAAAREALHPVLSLFRQVHDMEKLPPHRLPGVLSRVIRTSLVIDRSGRRRGDADGWRMRLGSGGTNGCDAMLRTIIERLAERVDQRVLKMRS